MSTFASSFELAVPQWLSAAVQYADGLEGLSHVWVVHQNDGGASVTSAAFKISGRFYSPLDLVRELSHRTVDELSDFYDELLDYAEPFDEVDHPNEMPRRIVVRYDVVAESMDAEFTFDEIIPSECEIPDNEVMDLWVERLKATGDDSAVMVMTPEQMKL